MTTILAIDPGSSESAYAFIDLATCRPLYIDKIPNDDLRIALKERALGNADHVSIEMIASYGMAVGKEVFETCVWIGRYIEATGGRAGRVYRRDIKLHHCASSKAKDANISQALIDRFASGAPNRGKGTKAAPGWFYGFRADIWQAYALAVYVADTLPQTAPAVTSTPTAGAPDPQGALL